ncbi:hypothetical protein [Azospirillum sp. sgz302134]
MATILSTPLAAANTDRRTPVAEFTPGVPATGVNNTTWVYVGPAANAIGDGATCTVTGAFAVNNTAGSYTADKGFAAGEYGWVRKTTSPL